MQIYCLNLCDESPSMKYTFSFQFDGDNQRIDKAEHFKFCLGQIINIPTDCV
jgi:hypothetical protein